MSNILPAEVLNTEVQYKHTTATFYLGLSVINGSCSLNLNSKFISS